MHKTNDIHTTLYISQGHLPTIRNELPRIRHIQKLNGSWIARTDTHGVHTSVFVPHLACLQQSQPIRNDEPNMRVDITDARLRLARIEPTFIVWWLGKVIHTNNNTSNKSLLLAAGTWSTHIEGCSWSYDLCIKQMLYVQVQAKYELDCHSCWTHYVQSCGTNLNTDKQMLRPRQGDSNLILTFDPVDALPCDRCDWSLRVLLDRLWPTSLMRWPCIVCLHGCKSTDFCLCCSIVCATSRKFNHKIKSGRM